MWKSESGLVASSSRTMGRCEVIRPTTIEGVLEAMRRTEGQAVFAGGGTDLCAQYNEGLEPRALIALDRIAALRGITLRDGYLRIGAGVTHAAGSRDPVLRHHLPGFAQAWGRIANERVRGWATIGGNLMACRPRYEMSVMLSAIDARLMFLLPNGNSAAHAPADLWRGDVPRGALLTDIALPILPGGIFVYDRSLRPVMTLAFFRSAGRACAAIATEMLAPITLGVATDQPPIAALDAMPDSFADSASGNWYLRQVGGVLLLRAMEATGG